jgi:hypothetical protein
VDRHKGRILVVVERRGRRVPLESRNRDRRVLDAQRQDDEHSESDRVPDKFDVVIAVDESQGFF